MPLYFSFLFPKRKGQLSQGQENEGNDDDDYGGSYSSAGGDGGNQVQDNTEGGQQYEERSPSPENLNLRMPYKTLTITIEPMDEELEQ